ncbi:2-phospho-L-lactate guanylyltransferase [Haloarchaeobius sp. DFWS5]|uniref:2-phospho-L-lactate guanylyltransferase n=1 Tax=Haloarchaeobius sp. DFWS5 TaxID=3446114 RepID=UPI003EBE655E
MRVVVPYAPDQPKSRLSPVLDVDERAAFARAMRDDVLDTIRATGYEPELLSTREVDCDAPVTVDDRSLSAAVNGVLAESVAGAAAGEPTEPVAVVMADLALATPKSLNRLFDVDGDVVVAPGRGSGTNALVVRHPEFRVDYHGASFLDHRAAAAAVDADFRVVDSHRLATDVDEPADFVEVLVHDDGHTGAAAWLREHSFRLERGNGRVNVRRVDG